VDDLEVSWNVEPVNPKKLENGLQDLNFGQSDRGKCLWALELIRKW